MYVVYIVASQAGPHGGALGQLETKIRIVPSD
jgi:hypothetical protein